MLFIYIFLSEYLMKHIEICKYVHSIWYQHLILYILIFKNKGWSKIRSDPQMTPLRGEKRRFDQIFSNPIRQLALLLILV